MVRLLSSLAFRVSVCNERAWFLVQGVPKPRLSFALPLGVSLRLCGERSERFELLW